MSIQFVRADHAWEKPAPQVHTLQNTVSSINAVRSKSSKFKGDLQRWKHFWNQCEGSVYNSRRLAMVDKFQCLRNYLAGKLEAMMSSLAKICRNYHEVA